MCDIFMGILIFTYLNLVSELCYLKNRTKSKIERHGVVKKKKKMEFVVSEENSTSPKIS